MEFTFEDLGVEPKRGGWEKLVPPTQTLDDGTLEIVDWVRGVKLVDYSYDKDNAIFTFEAEFDKVNPDTGNTSRVKGTIRKYIQDPMVKNHIINMDDTNPKKKEMIGYTYTEVMNLFKSFLKPYVVDNAVREIKPITLESLSTGLYKLLEDENNHNTQNGEVLLKLAFQHDKGVAPKYIVPQNKYLGNDKYPPAWKMDNKDPKWNDKKNFIFEEKTDDFSTPPALDMSPPSMDTGVDDVFGLNTPEVGKL